MFMGGAFPAEVVSVPGEAGTGTGEQEGALGEPLQHSEDGEWGWPQGGEGSSGAPPGVCGCEGQRALQGISVDKRALSSAGQGMRRLSGGCGFDPSPGVDPKEGTGSQDQRRGVLLPRKKEGPFGSGWEEAGRDLPRCAALHERVRVRCHLWVLCAPNAWQQHEILLCRRGAQSRGTCPMWWPGPCYRRLSPHCTIVSSPRWTYTLSHVHPVI